MKITFKHLNAGSLLAIFTIDDNTWLITGKIIRGPNGIFVTLPQEPYEDKKTGDKKYNKLVRVAGDKETVQSFNRWVIDEYNKDNNIDQRAPKDEIPW